MDLRFDYIESHTPGSESNLLLDNLAETIPEGYRLVLLATDRNSTVFGWLILDPIFLENLERSGECVKGIPTRTRYCQSSCVM